MIHVFVVEDSAVQREFLRFVIEQAGDFAVVGMAHNGAKCVKEVERLRPDIVLMDYHMPEMDGLEATRQIMQQCPTPIVIASASLVPNDVQSTFDAIKYGALALVEKPPAVTSPRHDLLTRELLRMLRIMAGVKVVRRRPQREATHKEMSRLHKPTRKESMAPRVVALAGSTGAPAIVAEILAALHEDLPFPILIVQHLSEGFVEGFARWLDCKTTLPVAVAAHGVVALPGRVYVAPDGIQMGITARGRIALTDAPPEDGFRPSATYLFRSVARAFGAESLGILLSGMGRDGAWGLSELRRVGAVTAAQDEASCVVFGMPREAIRLGAATHVLSPAQIAQLIELCQSIIMERERVRASQIGFG